MIHSRYSDKVVLITGGGGMGRAAALRILDESGKVVLTDCSPTVLKIWSKNLMQWAILIESYSFSRMYGSTRIAVRLYGMESKSLKNRCLGNNCGYFKAPSH